MKKSHDYGNKRTADDVEATVNTNANRVFANVFACCAHWVPVPFGFFFDRKITTNTQLTMFIDLTVKNRGNFIFRRLKEFASKKVWEAPGYVILR